MEAAKISNSSWQLGCFHGIFAETDIFFNIAAKCYYRP